MFLQVVNVLTQTCMMFWLFIVIIVFLMIYVMVDSGLREKELLYVGVRV